MSIHATVAPLGDSQSGRTKKKMEPFSCAAALLMRARVLRKSAVVNFISIERLKLIRGMNNKRKLNAVEEIGY